ncbi:MAG: hypothetical protein R2940_08755 [Syntrophotaleaceae bacterium]
MPKRLSISKQMQAAPEDRTINFFLRAVRTFSAILLGFVLTTPGAGPAQAENLALNKTVIPFTNTAPVAVYHPDNIVDGDDTTVWYSYQGINNQVSFVLDLGSEEEIGRYRFIPLQAASVLVETSLDNSSWTERLNQSLAFPFNTELEVTETAPYLARYVRYTSTNSHFAYVGLAEFEVHPPTPSVSFAGGDGSAADPFQIATAEQLDAIRDHLDAHFILLNDIDLDVAPYNTGAGWEPIGNYFGFGDPDNAPFTGSLDGAGYTIDNLSISRPDEDYVGLFGWASGAVLENLRLQVAITGKSFVAGLVGNIEPGTITNVQVTGTVTATANAVGGLAGRIRETAVADCSADAEISGGSDTYGGGTDVGGMIGNVQNDSALSSCFARGSVSGRSMRIGGLVGTLYASSMVDSYATGDAVGRESVGGLAGEHSGSSTISRSFATGHVTANANGNTFFGGLVGNNTGTARIADAFATGRVEGVGACGGLVGLNNTSASIARAYAVGRVVGSGDSVGGLVGGNSGTVETSYYNSETSGQVDAGKGTPATTDEMRKQAAFIDWDFPGVWKIVEDHTFPFLSWQTFSTVAPSLLAPVDGDTIADLNPTLAWLPAPGPDGEEVAQYQVQVATSPDFVVGLQQFSVSATGALLPSGLGFAALLLSTGTFVGRRRRVAVLVTGAALVLLLFNGCGGSGSSSSGQDGEESDAAISLDLQNLDEATTYYWRVRARDNQGQWSDWSTEWHFATGGSE